MKMKNWNGKRPSFPGTDKEMMVQPRLVRRTCMLPLLSSKVSGLGLSSAIGIREREDMNVNECSDAIELLAPPSSPIHPCKIPLSSPSCPVVPKKLTPSPVLSPSLCSTRNGGRHLVGVPTLHSQPPLLEPSTSNH